MSIDRFCSADIPAFLCLADEEQWIAEAWEFEFLLATFPQGCLCIRTEEGNAVAFVTALMHEQSGWIGNLIVDTRYRGRGYGERLCAEASKALKHAGAVTLWLTASKMGIEMYKKHGFTVIDTIVRWSGVGRHRHAGYESTAEPTGTLAAMCRIDSRTWGDTRADLLRTTVARGTSIHAESGFAVVQPCGEAIQIGPFSALDTETAELLLDKALRMAVKGKKICVDAPASNRPALRLFNRKGLRISGTNDLMYAGVRPDYRPEMLYGLATMGSCG